MKKQLKVLIPLLLCIIISVLFIIFGKVNYDNIAMPKFSPPSYVFIIVWSIIYLIFYLTMIKNLSCNRIYILYIIILGMHVLWNFLFFFMGYFLISLILMAILYFTSFVYVYYFSQVKKRYFYIYLVYLIWLMIATYLNIGVYLLN